MSRLRLVSLAGALLLAVPAGCAEGASGAGTTSTSGGGGDGRGGGSPTGAGGDGQGGTGQGGATAPAGTGGDGSGASTSGGGDGGGATSTSTSDASSSAMSSSSGGVDPGTIYFSEYVEGSGNNKALEIYNAGSTPIDLGNCRLDRYQNGASEPAALPLEDSMLAAGAAFVVCQSNFADPGRCDQSSADVQHNGDDAVALVCDGETKDIFGRIGEQPPDGWGSGQTSSEDATLRRKCSVQEGDTNGSDAFDPAVEWDGAGVDVFTDLGQYDCP